MKIKRSNIAAYETKNVEPRLSLISDLADYFAVPLEDLILSDLRSLYAENGEAGLRGSNDGLSADSVEEIRKIAAKVQRMLDGFKVFYEFKRKMNERDAGTPDGDIGNFLIFINHMTEYNRLIEDSLKGATPFTKALTLRDVRVPA